MAVYASSKDIDCHRCTATLQKFLGCKEDIPPQDAWGYKVTRCPRSLCSWLDFFYIRLYAEYKKGILPNPEGWLAQPMKYSAIMNIIESLMQKVERDDGK